MKNYFAYGSNMDTAQMAFRCPDAELVGAGVLHGYRFALDKEGVATVIPDKNSCVHGLVWRISERDEAHLDKYEGVSSRCYSKEQLAISCGGTELTMLTYVSLREKGGARHSSLYLERIVAAATEFDFPSNYIEGIKALM